jgi:hypothetical protein
MMSKMRHALMHGDEVAIVEEEYGETLSSMVDDLGRLAWVALFDTVLRISRMHARVTLRPIQPSSFLYHREAARVHVEAQFAVDREPRFDEIPRFELRLNVSERPYTDADGPASRPSPYYVTNPPSSDEGFGGQEP